MHGQCIVCNNELNHHIITLNNMPAKAQQMPSKNELSLDKGITLSLYQCERCGLVQFDCEPVDYYKDVIRACGISEKMTKMRREQYDDFLDMFNLKNKKIWEVGCGGGEFLDLLSHYDLERFGTENNVELYENAKKNNNVIHGFVDANYHDERGPFDAFLSFNFLEHQPDPNGMLKGIYHNTTDNAVGLITVPSLDYFNKKAPYFELIRDHIAMYSLSSLQYLLIQNGFEIIKSYMFNYDTLTVYVKKRKIMESSPLNKSKQIIENILQDQVIGRCKNNNLALWGASHQAFTILSTTNLKNYVKCVIDSAPFKIGRYTPATHIIIKSPEDFKNENIQGLIIVAPAYANEIAKKALELKPDLLFIISIEGTALRVYHDRTK